MLNCIVSILVRKFMVLVVVLCILKVVCRLWFCCSIMMFRMVSSGIRISSVGVVFCVVL